ncbi:MAG: hypothetical protein U9N04_03840 [Patescibacteria group bacterium]|nr:hypothetical protein [Patescibacteria group bacterium]
MNVKGIFQALPVFLVMLTFASNVQAGGFGVSPPQIVADSLLKGSVYEKTITFVQSEPDEDLQANIVFDAPEIESWISIDRGMSFVIPEGEQHFSIKVKISVPEDTPMGKYRGFIRVSTTPAKIKEIGEGSSVSINYGARIDLDLTVGNNVIEEFEILAINIKNIEPGWPLLASVKIQNTGNIPIKLDRATFELFDKYKAVRLGYGQTEEFEFAPPYSIKETIMQFPIDLSLGLGEYSGMVKMYKDGKVVKELQTPFRVVEKGTLPYSFEGIVKNDDKKDFDKNLLLVLSVLVLIIVSIIIILVKMKKKKIAKNEEETEEDNAENKEEQEEQKE